MSHDSKNIKFDKYSWLGVLLGLAVIITGIVGVVTSRNENQAYKNATDIRQVEATVLQFERKERKNDSDVVTDILYNAKVSYEVGGKTYKGRQEYMVDAGDYKRKYKYDHIRIGDTVPVEVYQTPKGEYKIAPDGNPVDFFLLCACIPLGIGLIVIFVLHAFGITPTSTEQAPPTGRKKKR